MENITIKPQMLPRTGISLLLFLSILVFPLVSSTTLVRVKKPKFSGTWTLNESKSEFGQYGRMWAAEKLIIVQKRKNMTIERFSTGPSGEEFHMVENLTLDGKECINTLYESSTKTSNVQWAEDKNSLTIISLLDLQMNGQQLVVESTEIFSLDEDGTLMIKSTSSSDYGVMDVVFAFDKVEDPSS